MKVGDDPVHTFMKIHVLDLTTMMLMARSACRRDKNALKKLEAIENKPSQVLDCNLAELGTYTRLALQEGVIPKEPFAECMGVRAKLFRIMVEYGEDIIL